MYGINVSEMILNFIIGFSIVLSKWLLTRLKVICFFRIGIITKCRQIELKSNLPHVCLIYKRNFLDLIISFQSGKNIFLLTRPKSWAKFHGHELTWATWAIFFKIFVGIQARTLTLVVCLYFYRRKIDFSWFLFISAKVNFFDEDMLARIRQFLAIVRVFNCFLHLNRRATESTKTNCRLKFTMYRYQGLYFERTSASSAMIRASLLS